MIEQRQLAGDIHPDPSLGLATVKTDPDNPSHVDDDNELDQPEPEQMDYDEGLGIVFI